MKSMTTIAKTYKTIRRKIASLERKSWENNTTEIDALKSQADTYRAILKDFTDEQIDAMAAPREKSQAEKPDRITIPGHSADNCGGVVVLTETIKAALVDCDANKTSFIFPGITRGIIPARMLMPWLKVADCPRLYIRADGITGHCIYVQDADNQKRLRATFAALAHKGGDEIVAVTFSEYKNELCTAAKPKPQQEPDPRAVILAKYAWIAEWEADPKKRFYKSTIHNAKINLRDELAALDAPIDITAELAAIKTQTKVSA